MATPSSQPHQPAGAWIALATAWVLALATAGVALAIDPPDGTTVGWNSSGFDLDAAKADIVTAVAVAPDGKMVIAGYASDGTGRNVAVVSRHLPFYGGLDSSFGSGGKMVNPTGFGGSTYARAVSVLADGSVLIAGTIDFGAGNSDLLIVKLTPTGSLDGSFGTAIGGGYTVVAFDRGDDLTDEGNAMAVDASGRIVVAGSVDIAAGNRDFGVVRLDASGHLDPTFGSGGRATVAFDLSGPDFDLGLGVALAPDGKIVVGGATRLLATGGVIRYAFAAARLLTSGGLDTTFGVGGLQFVDFNIGGSLNDLARAVAVDEEGRIVLAGEVAWAASQTVWGVARLLPNGLPDLMFNSAGYRLDTFICELAAACGAHRDYILSMALQADGKIVVAGAAYDDTLGITYLGVARLLAGGLLDATFVGDGRAIFHFDAAPGVHGADVANAVAVGSNGLIAVAGTIEYQFPDMDWGHMTLASRYMFEDDFERGRLRWSAAAP